MLSHPGTRGSPDAMGTPSVTKLHDVQEEGLSQGHPSPATVVGPLQGAKISPKHLCQPLKGGGCCSLESGPRPELGNNTEFSHLVGLCQEKPSDHWGGYKPVPLSSRRSKAPFKSFIELLSSSNNKLLLLERPLVTFRWQRGPGVAGITPGGSERHQLGANAPVATT